jgi:catechol 2,3-dioxygenase
VVRPANSKDDGRIELRLSHVALGTAERDVNAQFYREVLGLAPMGLAQNGVTYLGHGVGHHVLELHPGSGLDHFGLEVRGVELEQFRTNLAGRVDSIEERDGALWIQDPDGNQIELHRPIDRDGERTTDGELRPRRADHITFGSAGVEEMVAFYVEVLGLRISDRMEDDFVWMRGGSHHHDVAVVRATEAALDHYSYEIGSWEHLRTWCDRFASNGIPLTWGPGRHGPGHNLFVFIDDPDGRQVELSCEMEQFCDGLVDYGKAARVWRRDAAVANLWGPLPPSRLRLTATGVALGEDGAP